MATLSVVAVTGMNMETNTDLRRVKARAMCKELFTSRRLDIRSITAKMNR